MNVITFNAETAESSPPRIPCALGVLCVKPSGVVPIMCESRQVAI
jgi:hypothetical protein